MKAKIAIAISSIFIFFGTSLFAQSSSCYSVLILTQRGGDFSLQNSSGWNDVLGARNRIINEDFIEAYYPALDYRGGDSHIWYQLTDSTDPVTMTARGRLGGCVRKTMEPVILSSTLRTAELISREGIIGGSRSEMLPPNVPCDHEELHQTLPSVCPRMASMRYLMGETGIDDRVLRPGSDYYDASLDARFNPPSEVVENGMANVFDCSNVLRIEQATTKFDWEDDDMFIGVFQQNVGSAELEGEDATEGNQFAGLPAGGGYANFHYAVMPFHSEHETKYNIFLNGLDSADVEEPDPGQIAIEASELARCVMQSCTTRRRNAYDAMQYLLHLGNGSLDRIGEGSETPALRLHSMLPGAFWTKRISAEGDYDQCEWVDTRFQKPVQRVAYHDAGIWDWDAEESENPCVSIIMWEGDGGQDDFAWLFGLRDIDLTGDFMGWFKVCRADTVRPRENRSWKIPAKQNYSKDLTLWFETGRVECGSTEP